MIFHFCFVVGENLFPAVGVLEIISVCLKCRYSICTVCTRLLAAIKPTKPVVAVAPQVEVTSLLLFFFFFLDVRLRLEQERCIIYDGTASPQ